jgi:outer membrane protein
MANFQIMIRYSYLGVFFLMCSSIAISQKVHQLTLNQSVDLAVKNSYELRELQKDYDIQVQKNKEVGASTYPQVSLSGQMTYYTNLPQIQFPNSNFGIYEVLSKEGVKDANGNPIDISNASFSVNNVSFFAPFNTQFGAGISQLLFQPDIFVALQAKQGVLDLANINSQLGVERVRENVAKAYYNVLIAQTQREVLANTKERLVKLTNEMSQMFTQGFIEKLDVDRLQVTVNNTQTAYEQLGTMINISKAVLKNALGVPQSDSILITDKLDVNALRAAVVSMDAYNVENRTEIKLFDQSSKLLGFDAKRYELGWIPTVAAFYNISRTGQKNDNFAELSGSGNPWFWYTTGIVGLSVNATIFDGFARKRKLQQSILNREKLNITKEKTVQLLNLQKEIAESSLKSSLLNIEAQERNLDLSRNVFDITQKKFKEGLGSSFEIIQADTELQRAQGNYFQALYDGFVAKINMDKALGKL